MESVPQPDDAALVAALEQAETEFRTRRLGEQATAAAQAERQDFELELEALAASVREEARSPFPLSFFNFLIF